MDAPSPSMLANNDLSMKTSMAMIDVRKLKQITMKFHGGKDNHSKTSEIL